MSDKLSCAVFSSGQTVHHEVSQEHRVELPLVKDWPLFICEACTVRAILERELHRPSVGWILRFERMRLIDIAHHWAVGTQRVTSRKSGFYARLKQALASDCSRVRS